MEVRFGCVVAGHGEAEAVPILVRRIALTVDPGLVATFPKKPLRITESKLLKAGELERAVELAARNADGGPVLVLLDCDDGCPARLGPQLLERARNARSNIPLSVVLATREFEAWFLAAAESLRGLRGLAEDLTSPADPEAIRGAKEWLSAHMTGGRRYSETLHQPAFAAQFDMDLARKRSPSFDKCMRDVLRLLGGPPAAG